MVPSLKEKSLKNEWPPVRFIYTFAAAGICFLAGCTQPMERGVAVGSPPQTKIDEVTETLHGVEIRDPYRWLEDQQSPATRNWINEQNAYTDSILQQLPGKEELRRLATELLKIDSFGIPTERGGRYFFSERKAEEDLPILYFREGLKGEDQVLIDPHPMSENHTTSVSFRDISKDGKLVVYAIRDGGVDEVSIRVMDVDTRKELADALPPARYGSLTLTPDNKGFYYVRFGNVDPRVAYHELGTKPSEDRVLFGEGYTKRQIPTCSLSDDGRWLLVHIIEGSSGPTEIHLKDLESDHDFQTLIKDGVSKSFADFAGDNLIITTDLEAPHKRVMKADLSRPSVENWKEIIPESEEVVIESASPVGGKLFVSYLKDVQPRLALYDLHGRKEKEIEFDVVGSVGAARGSWDRSEAFFTFSSFHLPATIYRYDSATGTQDIWVESDVPIESAQIQVKQVRYPSKDGTLIPMFVVHRKGLALDGNNPTWLTGYGGFNISRTPRFSAAGAAWVQQGGVYALANLRGGGEFGEKWHRAGMLESKQNVFDDFIAAAEYLIAQNYTRPEHLAIQGGSNGGLLVGAAMTQRPDLFGAVVCTYPLLDMVRYHKFLVAGFWVPEYGSSEDADQFKYLLAYSPYQHVIEGGKYPATLFITGDGDTRVAPLHARKMTALVQARNGSGKPILLRYNTKAGHSGGQPVSEQIEQMVDILSFLEWQIGR